MTGRRERARAAPATPGVPTTPVQAPRHARAPERPVGAARIAAGRCVAVPRPVMFAILALGLAACGGAQAGSPGSAVSRTPSRLLPPAQFATAISKPDTAVIDVHVPYAGQIPGTTAFIPFNEIERRRSQLPPRSRTVAIYCRSGRMSAIAARTLARLGYRRVLELRGGMDAWRASGRRLRQDPARS